MNRLEKLVRNSGREISKLKEDSMVVNQESKNGEINHKITSMDFSDVVVFVERRKDHEE